MTGRRSTAFVSVQTWRAHWWKLATNAALVWLLLIGVASTWIERHLNTGHASNQGLVYTVTNGASLWRHDHTTTPPAIPFNPPAQPPPVEGRFAAWYAAHNGPQTLGTPVTAAFPAAAGLVQFFQSGVLVSPVSAHPASVPFVQNGVIDPATGVVRVSLTQALLTAGSTQVIGDPASGLTWASLREATSPRFMVSAPDPAELAHFVACGTVGTRTVGHIIPPAIWQYINQRANSPDGWQVDFGLPLTEALAYTSTQNATAHAMLVQVFWRGAVTLDLTETSATGQPVIHRLPTGPAYLRTIGPPPPEVRSATPVWVTRDTLVSASPGSAASGVHVGPNFRVTLTGPAQWTSGSLWYHVNWTAPRTAGTGWIAGNTVTFTSPGRAPAQAGFDVLSASLASYLANLGGNVGVVVYDITHNIYYTDNANKQFIMASSAKVPIMLTLLDMTERQGREPDANEQELLATMIENSNNDSAQALFDEIGGAGPIASYMQRIGVTGISPNPDGWGYSTVSPMAMVRMLTLLHSGSILTAPDRALALNLMENVEEDQQFGIGDTAPDGATVAMKDGWVPAPDGSWAMNSSGIITSGGKTWIIAVYTQEDDSLETGQTITEHVAAAVARLLS